MSAEHTHWMHGVTADRPKGNRIAGIIGSSSDDDQMFTLAGIPCFPSGTTFTPVQDGPLTRYSPSQPAVAWAVSLAIRGVLAPYIEQFRDGQYPAPLLAAGMTEAEIDEAHAVVHVQVGLRETYEGTLADFVASLGMVLSP